MCICACLRTPPSHGRNYHHSRARARTCAHSPPAAHSRHASSRTPPVGRGRRAVLSDRSRFPARPVSPRRAIVRRILGPHHPAAAGIARRRHALSVCIRRSARRRHATRRPLDSGSVELHRRRLRALSQFRRQNARTWSRRRQLRSTSQVHGGVERLHRIATRVVRARGRRR